MQTCCNRISTSFPSSARTSTFYHVTCLPTNACRAPRFMIDPTWCLTPYPTMMIGDVRREADIGEAGVIWDRKLPAYLS